MKPVQDLRQDLRDGVILAYLIEIVGQLDSDASVDENLTSFSSTLPSSRLLAFMAMELGRPKIFAQGYSHPVNKHCASPCII